MFLLHIFYEKSSLQFPGFIQKSTLGGSSLKTWRMCKFANASNVSNVSWSLSPAKVQGLWRSAGHPPPSPLVWHSKTAIKFFWMVRTVQWWPILAKLLHQTMTTIRRNSCAFEHLLSLKNILQTQMSKVLEIQHFSSFLLPLLPPFRLVYPLKAPQLPRC